MRYLMTFAYDGSNFFGYQIQKNKRTVQNEIEKALYKINGNKVVKIHASGRTDSGVHAINQKAHFDFKDCDVNKLKNSLNKILSDDIYIKKIEVVNDNFHARFNVVKKEYIYKINVGQYNPCMRNYVLQLNKELNIDQMQNASSFLIGEHNFKSFTKANLENDKEDFIRTIYKIDIKKTKDEVVIKFVGSGFMRYMVRNIVGVLLDVGLEKMNYKCVLDILNSLNRQKASITASAVGLYLNQIYY